MKTNPTKNFNRARTGLEKRIRIAMYSMACLIGFSGLNLSHVNLSHAQDSSVFDPSVSVVSSIRFRDLTGYGDSYFHYQHEGAIALVDELKKFAMRYRAGVHIGGIVGIDLLHVRYDPDMGTIEPIAVQLGVTDKKGNLRSTTLVSFAPFTTIHPRYLDERTTLGLGSSLGFQVERPISFNGAERNERVPHFRINGHLANVYGDVKLRRKSDLSIVNGNIQTLEAEVNVPLPKISGNSLELVLGAMFQRTDLKIELSDHGNRVLQERMLQERVSQNAIGNTHFSAGVTWGLTLILDGDRR